MEQFVLVLHVLISVTLIGLILIQHGKGAEAGASMALPKRFLAARARVISLHGLQQSL